METQTPDVRITPAGTRGRDLPGVGRLLYRLIAPIYGGLAARRVDGLVTVITVGARSGKRRMSTVRAFPEGRDAWLIVASFGGSSHHPAWFHNIARNPDQVWLRVTDREVRVRPASLQGEERNRAWERITNEASGFREYQSYTDREIPVVRLTAAALT
ncbi:MAG TPA: nitroreductase/quinone reductase family protein [Candidatus Dormibacteraeota bacterium]|nr:nitroreductase/quinone reductase family protein [Candidatus Dormibacteraeota bacterium]